MKTLGYYNGAIGEIEDMVIPMNDRVCWFGDGVYDAGPCHNYHIFAMEEHSRGHPLFPLQCENTEPAPIRPCF